MKINFKMVALSLLASTPIILAIGSCIVQPEASHHTQYEHVASYNKHNLDPLEKLVASQHAGHLV